MHFALFDSRELPSTPWKNGGGLTREIVCWPPGSTMHDFQWRLSIAEIAADGPFSAFEGIDRVITLLEGDSVHLYSADGQINHRLQHALQPFAFSGDTALQCELLGGACQDFNVMVRRSFGHAHVQALQQSCSLPAHGAVLVRHGQWQLHRSDGSHCTLDASGQDGAFWSDMPNGSYIEPLTSNGLLLAIALLSHAG